MDIFKLVEYIRSNEAAIEFLRQRGILRAHDNPPLCPLCGQEMAGTLNQHFRLVS